MRRCASALIHGNLWRAVSGVLISANDHESQYWKRPLLTGAATIRKYMDKDDITDAQFARIEREMFIGFYAVRKLLEAVGKVGPETRDMRVALKWYPKRAG